MFIDLNLTEFIIVLDTAMEIDGTIDLIMEDGAQAEATAVDGVLHLEDFQEVAAAVAFLVALARHQDMAEHVEDKIIVVPDDIFIFPLACDKLVLISRSNNHKLDIVT